MPKEYIERDKATEIIDNYAKTVDPYSLVVVTAIRDIVDIICPTSDVVEVVHGEWVVEAYNKDDSVVIVPYKEHQFDYPFCSICGERALLNGGEDYVVSNYCPNCGAKMDGERKEDDVCHT